MAGATTNGATKIEVQNLQHTYFDVQAGTRVHAIDNLNVAVRDGELMCVLGPSGCGKSTLLYIIAGLIRPTGGLITVGGAPVRGPGPDRGMVFQEYALLPWKNVHDNIALGLSIQRVPGREREERIAQIVDLAGLGGFEKKFPHELSGGMKQRVAVARTLVTKPKVMLMDEPFAAVDAQTRMTLQEEVVRIWQATGQTIMFVTHSVEEAVFLASRVAILSRRPAHLKEIVDIKLPRELRRRAPDREYAETSEHILQSVRSEVQDRAVLSGAGASGAGVGAPV